MRKGGSGIDRWSILGGILSVVLLVSGCGQAAPAYGPEGEYAGEPDKVNTEIAADIPEETADRTEEDQENGEESAANVIVGTWQNKPDPEREWMTSYKTCFSPDGRAVHYGGRNVDVGTWIQEGDIYTACFDDCVYIGISGKRYELPSYTVTFQVFYSEDGKEMLLNRNTDRDAEIILELGTEQGTELYTATDYDDYRCPLYYESDFSGMYSNALYYCPEIAEYDDLIRQGLLDMAEALKEGDTEEEREALPCTL